MGGQALSPPSFYQYFEFLIIVTGILQNPAAYLLKRIKEWCSEPEGA